MPTYSYDEYCALNDKWRELNGLWWDASKLHAQTTNPWLHDEDRPGKYAYNLSGMLRENYGKWKGEDSSSFTNKLREAAFLITEGLQKLANGAVEARLKIREERDRIDEECKYCEENLSIFAEVEKFVREVVDNAF